MVLLCTTPNLPIPDCTSVPLPTQSRLLWSTVYTALGIYTYVYANTSWSSVCICEAVPKLPASSNIKFPTEHMTQAWTPKHDVHFRVEAGTNLHRTCLLHPIPIQTCMHVCTYIAAVLTVWDDDMLLCCYKPRMFLRWSLYNRAWSV